MATRRAHVRALFRVAAQRVCEDVGFVEAHASTLDALGEVLQEYIQEVAREAVSLARHSRRSECNYFDVLQVLDNHRPCRMKWKELRKCLLLWKGRPVFPGGHVEEGVVPIVMNSNEETTTRKRIREEHVSPYLPPHPTKFTYKPGSPEEVSESPERPSARDRADDQMSVERAIDRLLSRDVDETGGGPQRLGQVDQVVAYSTPIVQTPITRSGGVTAPASATAAAVFGWTDTPVGASRLQRVQRSMVGIHTNSNTPVFMEDSQEVEKKRRKFERLKQTHEGL